ncbi:uncharacterized protein FOMMEDRAFT_143047 [Fomitiporia mediterranea MF3/22]|uniref:uncharacterized protein n=1 Tax=Fomitiporia mediterranea (strain MF3/22) TaxID=694068 RepID=UPI0004409B96|nr:uncharacterized protein FOMMEDRAFT_143047 [Fomitiporia mediterranea MF3/22]EJC98590.1 hypothetical protein FOMMEDRAFT_143047 [Fomitiporia mediterranea MF3/22]
MAIGYVDLISRLAQSTIDGIEQVFHASPESNHLEVSKNLEMLRQYIEGLTVHLASSGVGALPIITFPGDGSAPTIPSEATLLEETSKAVNVLYARQKQIQENSGTVASLLSAPESSRR